MKKYLGGLLMIFTTAQLLAQKSAGFISGGISLLVANNKNNGATIALPALTIYPGFTLMQKKDFSLLAGAPVSIGLASKDDHFSIGLDLPVSISMVSGYGFSNPSKKKSGFFLGAGAGYHNSYNEKDFPDGSTEKDHIRFTGFLIQSGLIVPQNKEDKKNGILIRLSWMSEYPDHKKNVFGIGLIAW